MDKTKYAHLSEAVLYRMLRTEKWAAYDLETRLALFQEVENRQAEKQGRDAMKVVPFKAPKGQGALMGYFSPENPTEICINEKFLNGKKSLLYDFSVGSGLDVIIHEGRHAYQHAVVEGKVQGADEFQKKMWALNLGAYVSGIGKLEQQAFYSQQEIERDAREYAERELVRIAETIREETGTIDIGFEKAIYKRRASEFMRGFLAELMLDKQKLDSFDELAKARYKELYPGEELDDITMFHAFREILDKKARTKADNPDRYAESKEILDQDAKMRELADWLKERNEKLKEKQDKYAFKEGSSVKEG